MRALLADAIERNGTHVPAANTAAVVTVAADADHFWVLDSIHFGYDGLPAAAKTLVVTIDGTAKLTVYVPADIDTAGPHEILFPRGFYIGPKNKNEALVVTLLAGGAGISGSVNITYR